MTAEDGTQQRARSVAPRPATTAQRSRYALVGAVALVAVLAQVALLRRSDEAWRETGLPKSDSWSWTVSISLANTSALLLAAALCIGPIRSIRRRRPAPPHLPWRRVVGVVAGVLAAVHVPLAYELHIPGWRLWWPFVTGRPTADDPFPIRTDDFAIAFAVGLLAAVVMAIVLLTSNTRSMRRFGVRRWKRVQRLVYLLGALVVLHVWFTQAFEFRSDLQRVLVGVVVAAVLALRLTAVAVVRTARADGARSSPV